MKGSAELVQDLYQASKVGGRPRVVKALEIDTPGRQANSADLEAELHYVCISYERQ